MSRALCIAWLCGEINKGPDADAHLAHEVLLAIEDETDDVSTSALRWLERMSQGRNWSMQAVRLAASRAACTAGSNSAMRIPMIAITTSNSTSVNPRWLAG